MTPATEDCPNCEVHPMGTCDACLRKNHPDAHKFHDQDTKVIPVEQLQRVAREAEIDAAEVLSEGE